MEERMVRSAARVALPVRTAHMLFPSTITADTQSSTRRPAPPALRHRRPLNAYETPRRARRARLRPLHPIIDNRYTTLGVSASRHAALYILLSPTGPYLRDTAGGRRGISLLTTSDHVRAWPGGTGGFKLAFNYAPVFVAQRAAAALGNRQLVALLDGR